jgi:DNA-binding NarL/FixJ family response regulator
VTPDLRPSTMVPAQRSPQGAATPRASQVALVEDHTVLADLLEMAIGFEDDMQVVGRAADAAGCLASIDTWEADVVVMDVRLSDGDGIALTQDLLQRYPQLRVVVLTAYVDAPLIRRAELAGAAALLPKAGGLDAVLEAIRASARPSDMQVPPALMQHLLTSGPAPEAHSLTGREVEVLRLLATGMDVRQICHELDVSMHTGRGHVKNILRKLEAHSQLEAVATAMRLGLINAAHDR